MGVAALLAAAVLSFTGGDEIVVTRESAALPSGCTPREAAELLVRFADAVNAGDATALRRVFAVEEGDHGVWRPERYFRWYSVNDATVYDLVDLWPYFAERHRLNERWELLGVDIGSSAIPGAAGISYLLRRHADDVPPSAGELAFGKGEIDCAAQRIFVWSMGQNAGVPTRPSCPLPADWNPGDSIVACARTGVTGTGVNAPAALPDFRIVTSSARFPRACRPARFSVRLRSALSAFNSGLGSAFAEHFIARGEFHTYTDSPGTQKIGRGAIARFAAARYAAGDGFTAAVLRAPTRRPEGRPAVYAVELVLTARGTPLRTGSAKIVVDCASGLIRKWVGPAVPLPRAG